MSAGEWVVRMDATQRATGPDGGLLYDRLVILQTPESAAYENEPAITPDQPMTHSEATAYVDRRVAAHKK